MLKTALTITTAHLFQQTATETKFMTATLDTYSITTENG